jgi:hypothetical protein
VKEAKWGGRKEGGCREKKNTRVGRRKGKEEEERMGRGGGTSVMKPNMMPKDL